MLREKEEKVRLWFILNSLQLLEIKNKNDYFSCMKSVCLFLFLTIPFVSFSQKIERFYDMNWKPSDESKATYYSIMTKQDSVWHQQDYFRNTGYMQMDGYFKDTADKIRHGIFHYYHANKLLQSTGAYVDNKRNGLWESFNSN